MRLPRVLACLPLAVALVVTTVATTAGPAAAGGCGLARAQSGRNPSYAQVSAAIDAAAQRRRVPPPLLKAIAWKESGWGQFWSDGRAKVSGDCGVGIMQITGGRWDYARLGRDYLYNVDAGAQALAAKMAQSSANVPPSLGSDERRVLENWYRATYRYNGSGPRAEAYVDSVFRYIVTPPDGIRPYSPPVPVNSPKNAIPGYRPTSSYAYVAHLDGRWLSTGGTTRARTTRADLLALHASVTPGRTLEGGQRATVTYAVRNLGWSAWEPSEVSVVTAPGGRQSALVDATWTSASAPTALRATVPTGAVARVSFPVRAALVSASQTVQESFSLAYAGRPLAGVAASSTWTIHQAARPTAEITMAPVFTLEDPASSAATLQLASSDPLPGAGLDWVEISTRVNCDGCAWTTPLRVPPTQHTARLLLNGAGGHDVRVRAVDRAGNYGEWSAARRTVVPRDDSTPDVGFDAGWDAVATPGAWLGGTHTTRRAGAWAETTAEGSRFAIIGATGPDLAELEIWLDGVLTANVAPRSDALIQRQVIWEGTTSPGRHHIRVRVAGTPLLFENPDAPLAVIDAIAAG